MAKHQDPQYAGHGGAGEATKLLSGRYQWPMIREDITRFVKNSDTWQQTKVVRHAPYGLFRSKDTPDRPWKSIAIDVISNIPK